MERSRKFAAELVVAFWVFKREREKRESLSLRVRSPCAMCSEQREPVETGGVAVEDVLDLLPGELGVVAGYFERAHRLDRHQSRPHSAGPAPPERHAGLPRRGLQRV